MKILTHPFLMIPLVSACVFFIFYMWSETVIDWLKQKSMRNREQIIKLLDLMFVEIDRKKITMLMLLVSFGVGFLFFVLFWPNIFAGVIFGSAVTILGWSLPLMIVKNMYERRSGVFVDQMIDGLTMMANGIKAGLSVTQSMERVVENMGQPISQEFSLVLSQVRLGRPLEEALLELGERIPKPDVQMFVTSINILKETGGNLGETFQTIVYTIRERQKIEKRIQAMTAQGFWQGVVVSLVPILIMVFLLLTDPKYVMPMFTTTLGVILTMIMFGLIIIGGLAVRSIVKIKV